MAESTSETALHPPGPPPTGLPQSGAMQQQRQRQLLQTPYRAGDRFAQAALASPFGHRKMTQGGLFAVPAAAATTIMTPHAKAALRDLERRRGDDDGGGGADMTVRKRRHSGGSDGRAGSGSGMRGPDDPSPLVTLRTLGRLLATNPPAAPSPHKKHKAAGARPGPESDSDNDNGPDNLASMQEDEDADLILSQRPSLSIGMDLDDENYTMHSIEAPRRAELSNRANRDLGPGAAADGYDSGGGRGSGSSPRDDSLVRFLQNMTALDGDGETITAGIDDGYDMSIQRVDAADTPARAGRRRETQLMGRESDFDLHVPVGLDGDADATFVLGLQTQQQQQQSGSGSGSESGGGPSAARPVLPLAGSEVAANFVGHRSPFGRDPGQDSDLDSADSATDSGSQVGSVSDWSPVGSILGDQDMVYADGAGHDEDHDADDVTAALANLATTTGPDEAAGPGSALVLDDQVAGFLPAPGQYPVDFEEDLGELDYYYDESSTDEDVLSVGIGEPDPADGPRDGDGPDVGSSSRDGSHPATPHRWAHPSRPAGRVGKPGRKPSHGRHLPAMFIRRVAKSCIGRNSSGYHGQAIGRETLDALEYASEWYLGEACADMGAFASHAGRRTVRNSDVELLMRRQRLMDDSTVTIFSLARNYLPAELMHKIRMTAKKTGSWPADTAAPDVGDSSDAGGAGTAGYEAEVETAGEGETTMG